jgi:hypothetical protein
MHDDELNMLDSVSRARIAAQERVLDRLAAAMFDMYEIVGLLDEDDAENLRWISPNVRFVYQSLALLMKRIAD